jgi:hypothetical protein
VQWYVGLLRCHVPRAGLNFSNGYPEDDESKWSHISPPGQEENKRTVYLQSKDPRTQQTHYTGAGVPEFSTIVPEMSREGPFARRESTLPASPRESRTLVVLHVFCSACLYLLLLSTHPNSTRSSQG